MHKMLKKLLVVTCVVAVSMIGIGNTALAVDLIVYTAVEAEDLPKYAANFNEDHPDIKIKWVRDSTGIMTAKLLWRRRITRRPILLGGCPDRRY